MDDPNEVKLSRSVFPPGWIPQAQDSAHKTIGPSQIIREHGVPPDVVTTFLDKDVLEESSCKSLPFTLLLVFAYSSVVIENDNAAQVNAVEDAMGFDIAENSNFAFTGDMGFKGFYDVNSNQDFWSWVRNGLIPLLFVQQTGYSEGYFSQEIYDIYNYSGVDYMQRPWLNNESFRGLYMGHNRIIAGLRLSQERYDDIEYECASPLSLDPVYNEPAGRCVGGGVYELDPEMWDARATAQDDRKSIEWVYATSSIEYIQAVIWRLERENWLDKHTQKVELAFPTYNAEYGIHAMVHMNFFFSRGGHIWKAIIPMSVFSDLLDRWFKIAADITFIICLLTMLFQEAMLIVVIIRTKGIVGIIGQVMQPVNLLDWMGVLAGSAVVTMMGFLFKFVQDLNRAGIALGLEVNDENMKVYIWELENAIHYYGKLRLVMAAYPLVIVFRLFKTFAAQARLAVVTNSLNKASVDLFHFMIIFIAIFGIYAIAATSLFGHSVDDLATLSRVFTTIFLAMLGDFDWDEIKMAGRVEAGIWFWTFMLLVSMILMNMLIAIVMDAYSEVKDAAKDSKTMMEEILTLAKRTIGQKPALRGTIGKVLRKLGVADIQPLVPLQEISICIKAKVNHLKKLRKSHQHKFDDFEEEAKHTKGQNTGGRAEPPPVDPSKCPEQYEVANLNVKSLCALVKQLNTEQASELLLEMVQRYHDAHQRPASYEDARLYLQALLHDLKALKHSVREKLRSPNSEVPEKSFMVRCAVDSLWQTLNAPDHDPEAPDPRLSVMVVPHNVKERVQRLDTELKNVRLNVDEELAKVSKLHWEVSKVREERMALENACQVLQERATELAVQNSVLHSRLPASAPGPQGLADDPREDDSPGKDLNLMQHLASEHHKLHTKLSARRLDLDVRVPGDKARMALAGAPTGAGAIPDRMHGVRKASK